MTYVLHFLFGSLVGISVYLMVDGYMALREQRRHRDSELDKYF